MKYIIRKDELILISLLTLQAKKVFPLFKCDISGKVSYQDVYNSVINHVSRVEGMVVGDHFSVLETVEPKSRTADAQRLYDVLLWRLLRHDYFLAVVLYYELTPNAYESYKLNDVIQFGSIKDQKPREAKVSLFKFIREAAFNYGLFDEYEPGSSDTSWDARTLTKTRRAQRDQMIAVTRNMDDGIFLSKIKFLSELYARKTKRFNYVHDQEALRIVRVNGATSFKCIFGHPIKLSKRWEKAAVVEAPSSNVTTVASRSSTVAAVASQSIAEPGGESLLSRKRKQYFDHNQEPNDSRNDSGHWNMDSKRSYSPRRSNEIPQVTWAGNSSTHHSNVDPHSGWGSNPSSQRNAPPSVIKVKVAHDHTGGEKFSREVTARNQALSRSSFRQKEAHAPDSYGSDGVGCGKGVRGNEGNNIHHLQASQQLAHNLPATDQTNVVFNMDVSTFLNALKLLAPNSPYQVVFNVLAQDDDMSNPQIQKIIQCQQVRTVTDPFQNGFFDQALTEKCSLHYCTRHKSCNGDGFSAISCHVCGGNAVVSDICHEAFREKSGFLLLPRPLKKYVFCRDCRVKICHYCDREHFAINDRFSYVNTLPDKKWVHLSFQCYGDRYLPGVDNCCDTIGKFPIINIMLHQAEGDDDAEYDGKQHNKFRYFKMSWCTLCNIQSFCHLQRCNTSSSRPLLSSKTNTGGSYFLCSACETTTCFVKDCGQRHVGSNRVIYIDRQQRSWARCCSAPGDKYTLLKK